MAEELDWSKLPPGLAWIAHPAERYGRYQFDEPILDFLRSASPAELQELREVQRRWSADYLAIDTWLNEYRMTAHPEARLAYFTQVLLGTADECGLL